MKKIFALLLSFTLIISPLSVQADAAMDKYTKNAEDGTGGTDSRNGKAFYFKQTAMISTAVVGVGFMACTFVSYNWSHYVFAAGAAGMVIGEIDNANDSRDYHKQKKEDLKIRDENLKMPTGVVSKEESDIQMTALQAARDEEEQNRKMIKSRETYAEITAGIYTGAVVMAGAEFALGLFPVYTGFISNSLVCTPVAGMLLNGIMTAYNVVGAIDHSNGKLGLSTVAFMAALQLESTAIATASTIAMQSEIGRAIFYGASAGIAWAVKDGLTKRKLIAEDNIRKLDIAINAWKMQSAPTDSVVEGTVNTTSTNYLNQTGPLSNYMSTSAGGTVPPRGKCLGQSKGGADYSAGACKNTLKFNYQTPKFVLPEIAKMGQQIGAYANALARDDRQTASVTGSAIAANAARMKVLQEETFKDINAKLAKEGKPAIDFNGLIAKKTVEMMKDTESRLNNGSSNSGALGVATLSDDTKTEVTKNEPEMKITAAAPVVIPAPNFGLSVGASSSTAEDPSGMSDAEKDSLSANYENTKAEYRSTDDDSIFQLLSKTYVRNLDKILTRKKKLEPEAAAVPSETPPQ